MIPALAEISSAAVDAVNYRVKELGESLEDAVRIVESSLRARGIEASLHLSTAPPAQALKGDNVAVYEVNA